MKYSDYYNFDFQIKVYMEAVSKNIFIPNFFPMTVLF